MQMFLKEEIKKTMTKSWKEELYLPKSGRYTKLFWLYLQTVECTFWISGGAVQFSGKRWS
jgi:hypothetical protein